MFDAFVMTLTVIDRTLRLALEVFVDRIIRIWIRSFVVSGFNRGHVDEESRRSMYCLAALIVLNRLDSPEITASQPA